MNPTDCPSCGCNDTRLAGLQRICNHCGHAWYPPSIVEPGMPTWKGQAPRHVQQADGSSPSVEHVPESAIGSGGVVWHVIRCPECSSTETRVTSTRRPVRHHKCQACGHCFKSVEA